jgi:hypothetical protein
MKRYDKGRDRGRECIGRDKGYRWRDVIKKEIEEEIKEVE